MGEEMREKIEIMPDALYSPEELADILGFRGGPKSRTNSVYAIPASELARTPTGPKGGRVMFRGRDILDFINSRRRVS